MKKIKIKLNNIIIKKGDKLQVDFNPHRWGNGLPDIQEAYVMHDDAAQPLSNFTHILVGRTKKEFYTISVEQIILDNFKLRRTLFD